MNLLEFRLKEALLADRPATRLYLAAPLAAGGSVTLEAAHAHRLRDVLRLAPGALVAAFNERDGEWLCRLGELGRGRAVLTALEQRCVPGAGDAADVWLMFAPIKRARLDWLVEKATELGAGALVPVWTARTQSERLNDARLRALAIAAAEQSERLSVPEIRPAQSLADVLSSWPGERRLLLCDETGAGAPLAAALAAFRANAPAAIMVGPEGGFTQRDLDAFGKLPIVTRVGLGPRVLRAETAAVAALAVFQAIAGDWRRIRRR